MPVLCRLKWGSSATIGVMEERPAIILNERYKLLDRAGSGGMAVVYRAQDLALGRVVAIKVLQPSLTGDEAFLRRFRREAHSAANLAHPNIVTVHDIGQDGRYHFMVMEYIAGRTLKQVVRDQLEKTGRPLPVARALDLAIQICDGLGYAHRAGFVHCDVKPQNVIVTADDRVKVADFGIARAMSQSQASLSVEQVWGTPQYFAPEQATGEQATPASDVYAIGVMLFEMLTGRTPFRADDPADMARRHVYDEPPLANQINPHVPAQLTQIVNKVLAKEPAGRYRTADQLGRILRSYQQNMLPAAAPESDVSERTTAFVAPPAPAAAPAAPPPRAPNGNPRRGIANERQLPAAAEVVVPVPATGRSADPVATDWKLLTLAGLALTLLLGLIPLWIVVYLRWSF